LFNQLSRVKEASLRGNNLSESHYTSLKIRVAREAATLLYTSQEKEYKQAKMRAAQNLGVRVLPSNIQVAHELDKIADEMEGASRTERLLQMRQEALEIMKSVKAFHPRLIGSVWRGTAHKDSDIDIVTFSSNPATVLKRLQGKNFKVTKTEWQSAPKLNQRQKSFHIHLRLKTGDQAEVVVRSLYRLNKKEKCEIYGDIIAGLSNDQLERLFAEDPTRKFLP
jgi:predicted nucleotidyltransferase